MAYDEDEDYEDDYDEEEEEYSDFSPEEDFIHEQEENQEYLSRIITREKEVSLTIEESPTSYADTDNKIIVLQKEVAEAEDNEELKRFWRAFNLHESAHISMSGSLKKDYKSWTPEKGEFGDFKDTVNVLEDVRIENAMTKILPQSKKYFVEYMQKWAKKGAEKQKREVLFTDNPLMALRLRLENKTELEWETAPEILPYLDEAEEKFEEFDVLNGNWANVIKTAYAIHDIFERLRKKFPKYSNPLSKMASDMMEAAKELSEADKDFEKLRGEQEALERELAEIDDASRALEGESEDGEDGEGISDEKKKEIEELAKRKEKTSKKLSKKAKEIEENKGKYDKAKTTHSKLSRDLERAKGSPTKKKVIEGLIRVTDFEDRKSNGKMSKLSVDKIIKKLEKLAEEIEAEEEDEISPFGEMERAHDFGVPEILEFAEEAQYASEGFLKIPEIELAIEMGDEIASELKRELKVKKSKVSKKTSGKLDLHRIRKQFTMYNEIRDTDIFSRERKLLPDHSVLVMIDFSGSMGSRDKLGNAKQAMATLGRTLAQLGVNFSLRGYSAVGGKHIIGDVILKEFGKEEANYHQIDKAFYPSKCDVGRWWGENRDGDSWRYGAELLSAQSGEKLLIVISDGQPYHGGTSYTGSYAMDDSELAVEQIEAMGIKTIGISIDPSANSYIGRVFKNHFFFDGDKVSELGEGLTEVYLEAMHFNR